eukprot:2601241-Alexandrium_andersonii.AAC.1
MTRTSLRPPRSGLRAVGAKGATSNPNPPDNQQGSACTLATACSPRPSQHLARGCTVVAVQGPRLAWRRQAQQCLTADETTAHLSGHWLLPPDRAIAA